MISGNGEDEVVNIRHLDNWLLFGNKKEDSENIKTDEENHKEND